MQDCGYGNREGQQILRDVRRRSIAAGVRRPWARERSSFYGNGTLAGFVSGTFDEAGYDAADRKRNSSLPSSLPSSLLSPGPRGRYPRPGADAGSGHRETSSFDTWRCAAISSRAEASACRAITQEWVLACNTKHLDDLLELYASDALMLLRSNYPPIRGAAAVREFFFRRAGRWPRGSRDGAICELKSFRDLAYEAGRCKAFDSKFDGKRREERGKYLWVWHGRATGSGELSRRLLVERFVARHVWNRIFLRVRRRCRKEIRVTSSNESPAAVKFAERSSHVHLGYGLTIQSRQSPAWSALGCRIWMVCIPSWVGAFQVQSAIVDEAALFGRDLGGFEGQAVDVAFRLAQADETGAEKQAEDISQAESFDAVVVEFPRFVVDRPHQILAGIRQRLRANSSIPGSGSTGKTCIREILARERHGG